MTFKKNRIICKTCAIKYNLNYILVATFTFKNDTCKYCKAKQSLVYSLS